MLLPKESTVQEMSKELGAVVSKLAAALRGIRDTMIRQEILPADDLVKDLFYIVEEIAFMTVREEELMTSKPASQRRAVLRYQSILDHLQICARTITSLVSELQSRFDGRLSFSEKAMEQTDRLFTQQEMILYTIEGAIRTGDRGELRTVCRGCSEYIRLCQRFSSEHEKRTEKGICHPRGALLFLTILDMMRSLVHHEREIVKLLVRWAGERE